MLIVPPIHVSGNALPGHQHQRPTIRNPSFSSYDSNHPSNARTPNTPPNERFPYQYHQQPVAPMQNSHYPNLRKENSQTSNYNTNDQQLGTGRFSSASSTSSILKQDPRFPAPQRSIHDLLQRQLPGDKWELAPPNEYDRLTGDSDDDDIHPGARKHPRSHKVRGSPAPPVFIENGVRDDPYSSLRSQEAPARPRTGDQHIRPMHSQTQRGFPIQWARGPQNYRDPPLQENGRPPPQAYSNKPHQQRPMTSDRRYDSPQPHDILPNGQNRESNSSAMSYRSEGVRAPRHPSLHESAPRTACGYHESRPGYQNDASDRHLMNWARRDEAARGQASSTSSKRTARTPPQHRRFPSRPPHEYHFEKKYSRGSSVTSGSGSMASDYLANSSAASSPPISNISSTAPRTKLQQPPIDRGFNNILQDIESQMAQLQPSPFSPDQTSISTHKRGTDTHCRACGKAVQGKGLTSSDGKLSGKYHKECFRCLACHASFPNFEFYIYKDNPYCSFDYHKLNGSICLTCGQGIEGTCLQIEGGERHHPICFTCSECGSTLDQDYFDISGRPYCERHAMRLAKMDIKSNLHMERRRTRIMMM
ncbi:Paxillin-like protein 1 [Neolecta irregularis DAH-3]|uniref:Paxillin-like protein 1 n=1 Tax=Neolecta irregularis (strain DAH-3) TaxID=1198029 RepID=A0A1U7LN82_NEOID|nr:Paxillin-like protein 1 [Neolecta irregularis DAH-3]|eukprot:OLL24130.1 Paxillin-like protein 1 [Neolecta irregularis DAH-3]